MARTVRLRACVLLLLTIVLVSPALAAGQKTSDKREAPGVVSLFWGVLGKFAPTFEKSRGSMDLNGSPAQTSTSSGSDSDSRGSMDPNG